MERFQVKDLPVLAYELPDEVLKYKMCGDLEGAKAAIGRWMEKNVGAGLKKRMQLELLFLDRLPGQFPLSAAEVIEDFRKQIPDFDEKDLIRVDQEGLAEWMWLDGEKHYIHNVVRNVLRKDKELIKRAGLEKEGLEKQRVLTEEIAEEKKNGTSTWKFRVRETIRLKEEAFYPGIFIRAHLPLPAKYYQVKEINILSYDKAMKEIDAEDSLARTICFEDALQENREFFAEYEYIVQADYLDVYGAADDAGQKDVYGAADNAGRKDVYGAADNSGQKDVYGAADNAGQKELAGNLDLYLAEEYPHIRFTPYLRALAAEIVGDETRPLAKARKLYDYVTKSLKYSFMREYFLLEDIPQYCARNLRGDCGVMALLFITLCRISGIPAIWQSGLYTHPCDIGAHDWALFYTLDFGWRFADISFGSSAFADGDEERRQFYFGNLEPFRMPANHAFQHPFSVPKQYLPIDPYDNQLGEMESDSCGFEHEQVEREVLLISAEKIEA